MLNRTPQIYGPAPMPVMSITAKLPVATIPAYFAGGDTGNTTEIGQRTTPERAIYELQSALFINYELRDKIIDIRAMDEEDGRIKKIHTRMARDITYNGLQMRMDNPDDEVTDLWNGFCKRLGLINPQKLKSDARGLIVEGNLPMQWVVGGRHVVAGIRMPSETIRPVVWPTGRFKDPQTAYEQFEYYRGEVIALFPLWQMTLGRLDPENFDDMGSPGRPYLDASRPSWRKLAMSEKDLVIRRHERAPMRTAHSIEGASQDYMDEYKKRVEDDQKDITSNYYMNRKGSVSAIQGDANMDEIKDVVHLLETFFAGAPAPAGMFGYIEDISRDILEDLKEDYYQEVASAQESLAWVYLQGFELELLLSGKDPDAYGVTVSFQERLTESLNQKADRALKYQAMGASTKTVHETAGLNADKEKSQRADEAAELDPYGEIPGIDIGDQETDVLPAPKIKVTPGNRPKGESALDIALRST